MLTSKKAERRSGGKKEDGILERPPKQQPSSDVDSAIQELNVD